MIRLRFVLRSIKNVMTTLQELAFHGRMLGIEHPIIQGRSMVGQATETAFGFGERLNERFRIEIGRRFRILSLSKNRKSVLMWGHYASSHRGVAIAIDPDASGFYQGHRQGGFEIHYSASREFKLPLAWYRNPRVEVFDSNGNILNSPDEAVESAGGLVVSFREYRRQVDEASITALTQRLRIGIMSKRCGSFTICRGTPSSWFPRTTFISWLFQFTP
jgi:hypothetical protein